MTTLDNYQQIKENFANAYAQYHTNRRILNDDIEKISTLLASLQEKQTALFCNSPQWIDELVRPVVNAILLQMPEWGLEDDQLTPFDLCSRVPVFFGRKDGSNHTSTDLDNSIYIVFRHGDLAKGELLYETGERHTQYKPQTIGAANGMNIVTKPLESVEEAVQFLTSQIQPTTITDK